MHRCVSRCLKLQCSFQRRRFSPSWWQGHRRRQGELGLERGPTSDGLPSRLTICRVGLPAAGYHLAVVERRTRSGRLRGWESLGLGVRSRCDGAGIAERSRPFQALRSTTGQPHSTAGVPRSAGRVGTPRGGQCVCTTGAHCRTSPDGAVVCHTNRLGGGVPSRRRHAVRLVTAGTGRIGRCRQASDGGRCASDHWYDNKRGAVPTARCNNRGRHRGHPRDGWLRSLAASPQSIREGALMLRGLRGRRCSR